MGATTTVRIDTVLKDRFAKVCDKNYNLSAKDALEILMEFILDFGVNPDDLSSLWRKNPKRDIAEYHNYTVGFLKTFEKNQIEQFAKFEKKQLELLEKFISLLRELISKNTIEKEVQNELIFDVQMIAGFLNEKLGEKLTERNNDNIIRVEKEQISKLKDK